jgi:hypothetical protein
MEGADGKLAEGKPGIREWKRLTRARLATILTVSPPATRLCYGGDDDPGFKLTGDSVS